MTNKIILKLLIKKTECHLDWYFGNDTFWSNQNHTLAVIQKYYESIQFNNQISKLTIIALAEVSLVIF